MYGSKVQQSPEEYSSPALDKKVILVDGEYFSWYGSRLKYAFNYFKSLPI